VPHAQPTIVATPGAEIVYLVLTGVGMHLVYLAVNVSAVLLLRVPAPEAKAVVIMGSHKMISTAVTLISYLPKSFGNAGLLTTPCIVGHLAQVFVDSAIVSVLAAREDARLAAAASAASAKSSGDSSDSGPGEEVRRGRSCTALLCSATLQMYRASRCTDIH
jgi:predicted Na+-dependent transporter